MRRRDFLTLSGIAIASVTIPTSVTQGGLRRGRRCCPQSGPAEVEPLARDELVEMGSTELARDGVVGDLYFDWLEFDSAADADWHYCFEADVEGKRGRHHPNHVLGNKRLINLSPMKIAGVQVGRPMILCLTVDENNSKVCTVNAAASGCGTVKTTFKGVKGYAIKPQGPYIPIGYDPSYRVFWHMQYS